jgi:hypothetical protein
LFSGNAFPKYDKFGLLSSRGLTERYGSIRSRIIPTRIAQPFWKAFSLDICMVSLKAGDAGQMRF